MSCWWCNNAHPTFDKNISSVIPPTISFRTFYLRHFSGEDDDLVHGEDDHQEQSLRDQFGAHHQHELGDPFGEQDLIGINSFVGSRHRGLHGKGGDDLMALASLMNEKYEDDDLTSDIHADESNVIEIHPVSFSSFIENLSPGFRFINVLNAVANLNDDNHHENKQQDHRHRNHNYESDVNSDHHVKKPRKKESRQRHKLSKDNSRGGDDHDKRRKKPDADSPIEPKYQEDRPNQQHNHVHNEDHDERINDKNQFVPLQAPIWVVTGNLPPNQEYQRPQAGHGRPGGVYHENEPEKNENDDHPMNHQPFERPLNLDPNELYHEQMSPQKESSKERERNVHMDERPWDEDEPSHPIVVDDWTQAMEFESQRTRRPTVPVDADHFVFVDENKDIKNNFDANLENEEEMRFSPKKKYQKPEKSQQKDDEQVKSGRDEIARKKKVASQRRPIDATLFDEPRHGRGQSDRYLYIPKKIPEVFVQPNGEYFQPAHGDHGDYGTTAPPTSFGDRDPDDFNIPEEVIKELQAQKEQSPEQFVPSSGDSGRPDDGGDNQRQNYYMYNSDHEPERRPTEEEEPSVIFTADEVPYHEIRDNQDFERENGISQGDSERDYESWPPPPDDLKSPSDELQEPQAPVEQVDTNYREFRVPEVTHYIIDHGSEPPGESGANREPPSDGDDGDLVVSESPPSTNRLGSWVTPPPPSQSVASRNDDSGSASLPSSAASTVYDGDVQIGEDTIPPNSRLQFNVQYSEGPTPPPQPPPDPVPKPPEPVYIPDNDVRSNDNGHGGRSNDDGHGGHSNDNGHGGHSNDNGHGGHSNDNGHGGHSNDNGHGGQGKDDDRQGPEKVTTEDPAKVVFHFDGLGDGQKNTNSRYYEIDHGSPKLPPSKEESGHYYHGGDHKDNDGGHKSYYDIDHGIPKVTPSKEESGHHYNGGDHKDNEEGGQNYHEDDNGEKKPDLVILPRSKPEDFFSLKKLHKELNDDDKNHVSDEDNKNFFPHQYNIEVRKRIKLSPPLPARGPKYWLAEKDKNSTGVHEGGERHLDKELELAKYRLSEHKEEEHWHEKKWLKKGLAEEYIDGKGVPVKVGPPPKRLPETKEEREAREGSNLPYYARPMDPAASKQHIDAHFAIPSPGFRVNEKFMNWVKNDVGAENGKKKS